MMLYECGDAVFAFLVVVGRPPSVSYLQHCGITSCLLSTAICTPNLLISLEV